MKYRLKTGMEIELHEEDVKNIANMYAAENFDGVGMQKYFEDLHKHAVGKMEHISEHIITDEESIDIAMEYVMRHGTYMDFVKMLRYSLDANLAYHTLESFK